MEKRQGAAGSLVVAFVLLAPAMVALSFVGPLREYAAILWAAGLVLTMAALVHVLRGAGGRGHRRERPATLG